MVDYIKINRQLNKLVGNPNHQFELSHIVNDEEDFYVINFNMDGTYVRVLHSMLDNCKSEGKVYDSIIENVASELTGISFVMNSMIMELKKLDV